MVVFCWIFDIISAVGPESGYRYRKGNQELKLLVHPVTISSLNQMALRHGVSVEEELEQIVGDRTELEKSIAQGDEVHLISRDGTDTRLVFHLKQEPYQSLDDVPPRIQTPLSSTETLLREGRISKILKRLRVL